MGTPGWDSYRARETPGPRTGSLEAFSHIEGLCGEESALLAVPHHERSHEEHARLHALEHELDRVWAHLRERAERHARRPPPPPGDAA